ncbi:phosphopentomutase [Agrilactobacillus yilanensis]|uniref:Phosphopentomutase n=1 Tax=Agrilactobacillus yilanensis TaxID=2485997 RepID=A0ABW4J2B2_9LACO|nr:phosphopentomutase [Agrilactobacillus yilanensis]
MYQYQRIFTIVLDSVGTGSAPDAVAFNDVGADTLGHVASAFDGALKLPNLQKLGLANLRTAPILGIPAVQRPLGYFGTMTEISAGKDSMDGHWEMMGLPVQQPLDYFPNGFPEVLLTKIATFAQRKIVGNCPASGTEIIKTWGQHQLATGDLIIYTSGDSVLQIAAHEAVIPVSELYRICTYARSLLNGPTYTVGRVIARPYVGTGPDDFTRTAARRDFALKPTGPTVLDKLQAAGLKTIGIGKIKDIFSGQGLTQTYHNESNTDGMGHLAQVVTQDFTGFCFVNLVDFDAMYGHRRDPLGFGHALMTFDQQLGTVLPNLRPTDLLLITADHGNDPTYRGTDHTREQVPLLAYSPSMTAFDSLGQRTSFADLGASILENFALPAMAFGQSFLTKLK